MKIYVRSSKSIKQSNSIDSTSSSLINESEQEYILGLFNKSEVNVLDTYEARISQDGVIYNEFIVVTDNTNQIRLGGLLKELDMLDEENEIGSYNEENEHGFYAKDYHFFHYVD